MKKILAFLLVTLLFATGTTVFAEYYNDSQDIYIQLENQIVLKGTKLNIVRQKDAAFSITFNLKEKQATVYDVAYTLNGKVYPQGKITVEPYKETKKLFFITAPYGKHELSVSVKRNGTQVATFNSDLSVSEGYTHQFMDEFHWIGANTHFGHSIKNDPDDVWNLNIFEFLEFAGIKKIRDGLNGAYVTNRQNNFNIYETYYSKNTKWFMEKFQKSDLELYQSGMYVPVSSRDKETPYDVQTSGSAPRTVESINFYCMILEHMIKNVHGANKEIGIWNEPNIVHQWKPQDGKGASDYANLVKQAALTARNINPDIRINAFTAANAEVEFMETGFEQGLYPYITGIDYHWYCQNDDPENADFYGEVKRKVEDTSLKYGGWLDKVASEIGVSITRAKTEERQSYYFFKEFSILNDLNVQSAYIYDFGDDGTDPANMEHNFGLLTFDQHPKKSYLSYIRWCNEFSGAVFVGKVDLGIENTWAYLYLKDGKPRVSAWLFSKDGTQTVEFKEKGITARDIYGNTLCENADSVVLGMEPIVIDGLGMEWAAKAAMCSINDKHTEWVANYEAQLPQDIITEAKALFEKTENLYENTPDESLAKSLQEEYFAIGEKIIAAGKAGDVSELIVSQSLYQLYRIVMPQNAYYIGVYNSGHEIEVDMGWAKKLADDRYRSDKKMLQYSDKIFRIGKDYYDKSLEVKNMEENPQKAGIINGYSLMSDGLLGWFESFSEYETVLEYGYTIQIAGYDLLAYTNEEKTIRMAIRNQGMTDFSGVVRVYDENRKVVYETSKLKIKQGTTVKHQFVMHIPEPTSEERTLKYTYCLIDENGSNVMEQPFTTIVKKTIDVSVLSSIFEPKNMKSLGVKVTNNRTDKVDFTISFKSSEELKLGQESVDVTLEPLEEKVIEVPISYIENTEFHFYPISYVAKDKSGAVIAKSDTLLNFTCVTKASEPIDIAGWDGSLEGWHDAYPIYIATPDDAKSYDAWHNSDLAARMFLKWNENNLYILADVYDNTHLQVFNGSSMWQGDSIQIGIDPENERLGKYNDKTYEIGITKGEFATDFWCWNGNAVYDGFDKWIKIIRDDEQCTTRYLMAVPKETISRLKLEQGTLFGFNFAVNDADVLGRDLFIEYTLGLASSKNPGLWNQFKLLEKTDDEFVPGSAKGTFK